VVATLINTSLTPQGIHDGGWRIPFLLGGVFGLVDRHRLLVLEDDRLYRQFLRQRFALLHLKKNRRLLTWLLSAGVVVVILMSPVWLQKHYGFAPAMTLQA
jgi:MFS family permease